MPRFRMLALSAPLALLALSAMAQTITVKELMQASACRDQACFSRFAAQKGYAAADSISEEGSTTVIYLPSKAGADELAPELGITLPPRDAGPDAIPTFHYACYEEATFQRLLTELAALGFAAEDGPHEVGPGMVMTDLASAARPDLHVWTLTGELETDDGPLTYHKLGVANME